MQKNSFGIPKRMFMSIQPLKSEIPDNPAYRNIAAQLALMHRNVPSSNGSVERADGVIQTESVLIEREKEVEEPKVDSISDESEIDPVVTKKPETAPTSVESIMALWNWKKTTKSNMQNSCLTLSSNQKQLQSKRKTSYYK